MPTQSLPRHPLLAVRDLTVGYGRGEEPIFTRISFDISRQDFIGVIGPNGGGKTTLIKSLLGLVPTQSGTITFFRPDGSPDPHPLIGYVPQQSFIDRIFPISVTKMVEQGLLQRDKLRLTREEHERVGAIIGEVGLYDKRNAAISTLSGGQMQRALLARALVSRPELLILDEPNTYVDKSFQHQLNDLLTHLQQSTAILLVSHDIGSVSRMVRRLFCVNRGLHIHEDLQELLEHRCEADVLSYITLLRHTPRT